MKLIDKFPLSAITSIEQSKLSEVEKTEIIREKFIKSIENSVGRVPFKLVGEAGIIINLLNDANDEDDNDIAQKLNYDPILNDRAILNYTLYGEIKAEAGFESGLLKADLNGNQKVIFNSFKIHDNQNKLKESILSDILDFKLFIDQDHVLALKENEALSMSINGFLDFEAEVRWSDVLTAGISQLSKLFKLKEALLFEVDSCIKLEFGLSIKDQFEAIVQRKGTNLQVCIKKSIQKGIMAGMGLQFEVKLQEPQIIEKLINKLFDSAEKGLSKEIDAVLAKGQDKINEDELQILLTAADLLGIDTSIYTKENLFENIAEKRKEITNKANEIISNKIKVGVAYNYSHIQKNDTLFEANFTDEAIKNYHKKIVALKIADLYKAARKVPNSGISDLSFEKIAKLDIKKSTKIGISIGRFSLGKEVDKDYVLATHEIFKEGQRNFKVTDYTLGKTVALQTGLGTQTNAMSLSASMEEYVQGDKIPMCSDFDFEMTLSREMKQGNRTRSHELKQILDFALCWGIIHPDDFIDKYNELEKPLVKSIKQIEYEAYIKAPFKVFNLFIDDIGKLSNLELAEIMAESVPYAEVRGRKTLRERMIYYKEFWIAYLNKNPAHIDSKAVKDLLRQHFMQKALPELAYFEADEDGYSHYDHYAIDRLISHNFIGQEIKLFKSAVEKLHSSNDQGYDQVLTDRKFRKNMTSISVQQEFNMRLMGRLLHRMAEKNGVGDILERALEIRLKEKVNGNNVFLITS